MAKMNDMGKELFVINEGGKRGFLGKKQDKFIAYENGLEIRIDNEVTIIKKENIFHMYRKFNTLEESDTLSLEIIFQNNCSGFTTTLPEDTFPNLIERMEEVSKNVWRKNNDEFPTSVKWFLSIISNFLIIMERPYDYFGTPCQEKQEVENDREILVDDWGIRRKSDLIEACEKRFEFPLIEQAKKCYGFWEEEDYVYNEEDVPYEREIIRDAIISDFDKTIKGYEMYRVILLAYLGFTSRFFTYEEALDWCLRAGEELQKLYISWDDYYENYMLGYCFWRCEDVNLEYTHANMRKVIFEEVRKFKTHPWQIDWNTELKKEW